MALTEFARLVLARRANNRGLLGSAAKIQTPRADGLNVLPVQRGIICSRAAVGTFAFLNPHWRR